jgi:hypothetical protein
MFIIFTYGPDATKESDENIAQQNPNTIVYTASARLWNTLTACGASVCRSGDQARHIHMKSTN